ncbi:von Willebrand factor type A domain-containing protein [Spirillospora sp. NPDC047279]|uniref:vWA domain-containing protein n=1 Tax=Spirillospora sp. NPDC047279 TaxID=3155478 RepID=UPI0033F1E859
MALLTTACSGPGQQSDSTGGKGIGAPARPAIPEDRIPSTEERPSSYLSTFALDVDTASYGYARRALLDGRTPDPRTIRPEEFVNTFKQGYAEPEGNGFAVSADGGRTGDVRLLRVGLQTRRSSEGSRRDANLTFVVDTSGSMDEPGRLDLVKSSLHALVDQLRPSDSVAIVAYSSDAEVVREMTPASDRRSLHRAIDSLETGDSTNIEAGMTAGYKEARRAFRSAATNRVILASDGLANTGSTSSEVILRQVKQEANAGVSLLCVGVGSDYGDKLMEQLADNGNGRAVYVSDVEKAKRLFVQQLPATIELRAKDAKAQVAFDSRTVQTFRLIGYDNRGLRPQDLRDDSVDGGEIGPGHSVTALYAVRLRPEASGHLADVTVRWQDPGTGEPAEQERPITVDDVSPDLWESGAPRLRVSVAAAYFAEHLRDRDPGYAPQSPYTTPSQGPFVTQGRLPGEQTADLGLLARQAAELGTTTEDRDVRELADLINRAREL